MQESRGNKGPFFCINANSLCGKSFQLDEDADTIFCQEIKLDPSVHKSELFSSSFMVLHKDRTLDGGGVCMANYLPMIALFTSADTIEL